MKIHPTAIVHKDALLADDVEIGPYTVVGPDVTVAVGTKIGNSCTLEGWVKIGKNCRVFTGTVIGSSPQDLEFKGEKSSVEIGDNNIIREYVTINRSTGKNTKTQVGSDNFIMAYAHIAHNCVVGSRVVIANMGTLAGHATVEDKAILGGLAAVHQFTRIGRLSIIGGCSKVVKDIPPYATADGHPAKIYGLNVIGLRRSGKTEDVRLNLNRAYKILFNSGLNLAPALKKIEEELPLSPEITHLIEFIRISKRGLSASSRE